MSCAISYKHAAESNEHLDNSGGRARWIALAEGVRAGDSDAVEALYSIFQEGFRFLITRQLGANGTDDSVHSCLVTVVDAVQKGQLRDPSRLNAFAATVVRRHLIHRIRALRGERNRQVELNDASDATPSVEPDPENMAVRAQTKAIAAKVLRTLSARDQEMLKRFYLLDQSEERIRVEMRLTANQFRNVKHRAKSSFLQKLHKQTKSQKDDLRSRPKRPNSGGGAIFAGRSRPPQGSMPSNRHPSA